MKILIVLFLIFFGNFFHGGLVVNSDKSTADNVNLEVKSSNKLGLEKYSNVSKLNFMPVYNKYNLCKEIKKGDIIFEAAGGAGITHHIAVVEDVVYSNEYDVKYIKIIEAIKPNVCYGIIDDYRFDAAGGKILRYKNGLTEDQIGKILYFLHKQVGKEYNEFRPDVPNTSIDAVDWYCSSLAYSAYLYAGIDLYPNNFSFLTPGDILKSKELVPINTTTHICEFNRCTRLDRYYHDCHCVYCGNIKRNQHFFKLYSNYKECHSCGYRIYDSGIEQLSYSKKMVTY